MGVNYCQLGGFFLFLQKIGGEGFGALFCSKKVCGFLIRGETAYQFFLQGTYSTEQRLKSSSSATHPYELQAFESLSWYDCHEFHFAKKRDF